MFLAMRVFVYLVSFCCALALSRVDGSGLSTCVRNYEKVGCYDEYHANVKDLVVYDRYGINWDDIVGYMHHLACACESKVREVNKKRTQPEQYVGFALHFWGECYGRTQVQMDALASKSKSERCTGDQTYTKCFDKDPECTGHAFSEFVYKLKAERDIIHLTRGCNYSGFTIACKEGRKIYIDKVLYGKRTKEQCGVPLSTGWTEKCRNVANATFEVYESQCSGHPDCIVNKWNKDPQDPCPAVDKFVDVYYKCKS